MAMMQLQHLHGSQYSRLEDDFRLPALSQLTGIPDDVPLSADAGKHLPLLSAPFLVMPLVCAKKAWTICMLQRLRNVGNSLICECQTHKVSYLYSHHLIR